MKLQRKPFNRLTFTGLVFLAIANVIRILFERHTHLPENPRDAFVGVLYGLAIGTLLLGVWRMSHPAPPSDRSRCA